MRAFWGRPVPSTLYFGMQVLHLRHVWTGLENTGFVGASYRGYGIGTFTTSYGDRAVVVGAERNWGTARVWPGITVSASYRLGLMYGYDEQLTHLAGQTPLFPLFEPLLDIAYKRVGIQLAYAGIIATFGGYYRP